MLNFYPRPRRPPQEGGPPPKEIPRQGDPQKETPPRRHPPAKETPRKTHPQPRRPPAKETPLPRRPPAKETHQEGGTPPKEGGTPRKEAPPPPGPHPRGKLRGIRSRPTLKGGIEGDQIQAHTQRGNWWGSDPGQHPRGKLRGIRSRPTPKGKLRGIRSRPTPKGEIEGDQPQAPWHMVNEQLVRILLECILVSHASAKAEHGLSSLSCMCMCVDQKKTPPNKGNFDVYRFDLTKLTPPAKISWVHTITLHLPY